MSVEFIGYAGHFNSSETMRRTTGALDPSFIEAAATAQEHVGFDRVLVAFNSTSAESILVAQPAASVIERLGLMIAHRPGLTAPTLAARQLAPQAAAACFDPSFNATVSGGLGDTVP